MELEKDFYSTTELAELMGLSRVSIWNKIKNGKIPAKRYGKSFLIPKEEVKKLLPEDLPEDENHEEEIRDAVRRVVREYRTTLKKLGEE